MSKAVPKGWEICSFDSMCVLQRGFDLPLQDRLDGDIPIIGSNGVVGYHNEFRVNSPGIVTGRSGSIGIVLFQEKAFWPLNTSLYIKDFKSNAEKFIFYFLQHFDLKRFATGTGVPTLNRNDVHIEVVVKPPHPEQQKIASILTAVDDVIESTQAQINKLKDLKTGMMQELLTKGIGHTEFKDSPVGRIPKAWHVKRLGDVCSLQGGYAFKSSDALNIGSRWLKISNVGKGEIIWEDRSFLPNSFLDTYKDFSLNENDVILALTRPVLNGELKVAKISSRDLPALINQRVARVLPNFEVVTNDYLYVLFLWEKMVDDIETTIFGTDPPNVSTKQIEEFLFPIPEIEEQIKIAKAIKNIITRTHTLNDKLKSTMNFKKALMQDLLTGTVRVQVNN